MVATEYYTDTDLLRKQRPSECLQDYIAYWMEMCHKGIKMGPSMINNKLVIAGAKNINTLPDASKSAQVNLLKLKKYEGLVSDDEQEHTVHTVNQITSKGLHMTNPDKLLMQQMVMDKSTFHQLMATLNKCPTSNSKYKYM